MTETQNRIRQETQNETAHIGYLLAQIPRWRASGWVSEQGAAQIESAYGARRQQLQAPAPMVPPLPPRSALPIPPTAAAPVYAYLQANGLKIVFALATLLTLAALRSLLQWDWADALLVRMIPLIPLSLTAMFIKFGHDTQDKNRWGAFAFEGMACALLAFDVLSVNRHWLSGAIPLRPLLALAFGTATLAAGGFLRRRQEANYLHLFVSGVFLTLYAVLQNLRPFAPAAWPLPVLWFGGAYLTMGAVAMAFAIQANRREPASKEMSQTNRISAEAWLCWTHIVVTLVTILTVFGSVSNTAGPFDRAILAVAAGLIYGAGAQFLNRDGFAYMSGFFVTAGLAGSISLSSKMAWIPAGWLLLGICSVTLSLAVLTKKRGENAAKLAAAWQNTSKAGLLLLATGLWGVVLFDWHGLWSEVMVLRTPSSVMSMWQGFFLSVGNGAFYLVFAKREHRTRFLYGVSVQWGLAILYAWQGANAGDDLTNTALAIYGMIWGGLFLLTAKKTGERHCVIGAAAAFTLGYGFGLIALNNAPAFHWELALLPLWTAFFAPTIWFRRDAQKEALFARPLRQFAWLFSALTLLLLTLWELSQYTVQSGAFNPVLTVTLLAYALVYGAMAAIRKNQNAVFAGAFTLTCAYAHGLIGSVLLSHSADYRDWPRFAFLLTQAGILWMAAAWAMRRRWRKPELARPLLLTAGIAASVGGLIALSSLPVPHEGRWTILTLAWGGVIWFALWLMESQEACLHLGAANLLLGWMLVVYERFGAGRDALDMHLLPVALYLLALGFREGRRAHLERSQWFWALGCLLLLTPPFLAYWQGGAGWHTALFVSECTVAVVLGTALRIRAFAGCGLFMASLFAAGHLIGRLPGVMGTLAALLLGVGLFAAGFYALTHREQVQEWAALLETRWREWR